jgi:diaminohydroxyphosphoribosylaminopyrimidine deaminase/5-amino-6-(5-phosphoribosylamino)uracil reductase
MVVDDEQAMRRAIELGASVRASAHPNPWVGCVIESVDGHIFTGATRPPGEAHAEVVALEQAGAAARGATVWVTLEPCAHTGRTPPCVDALVAAGVRRVVVALEDPDVRTRGRGLARLRAAGVDVVVGVGGDDARAQLAPYIKHRTSGRPWVILKLAATIDGRIAAPDGTSQWITGARARADAHRLRAESDAVLVGAGTVKADDPSLRVRLVEGRDPTRVVLGSAPPGARCQPCLELSGDPAGVLDELGRREVVQVLVEGGAFVAGAFHRGGLVDRYVIYLAPALLGGDDGRPLFGGRGATTIADAWRGRIESVQQLGADLRVELSCSPA